MKKQNGKSIEFLSRDEIKKLKKLKNQQIIKIVEEKLIFKREDSIEDEKLDEAILLIEAKKKLFKDDPEFKQKYKEAEEYYSKSKKLESRSKELFKGDIDTKIDNYVEKVYKQELEKLIKGRKISVVELDSNLKKDYGSLLLAGLEIKDTTLKATAIKEFKSIYSELENIEDFDEFRKKAYKLIFDISDETEIDKKAKEIQKNLEKEIISKKEVEIPGKFLDDLNEAKIADNQFDKKMLDKAVEIKIDLSQGIIQNSYKDSRIEFTEGDEKLYQELYRTAISNSWITNSKDAKIMKLLSLYRIKDSMEKKEKNNPLYSIAGAKKTNSMIEEMLDETPELKTIVFDENGQIKEDVFNQGKKFRRDSLYAALLGNTKKALTGNTEMHKKEKLKCAILAYKYTHPPKDGVETQVNQLLEKLGNRIFEMLSTEECKLIQFDKDGKPTILEDNIRDFYNELNPRHHQDSFVKICTYEDTVNNIFGAYASACRYSVLNEEDYKNLEENFKSIEERNVELEKLQNKRNTEKFIMAIQKRRFSILEDQVSMLSQKDIKEEKNPVIVAVWYNYQINQEKLNNPDYNADGKRAEFKNKYNRNLDDEMSKLMEQLREGENLNKNADIVEIGKAIGDIDDFKKIISLNNENKEKETNSVIKRFRKQY